MFTRWPQVVVTLAFRTWALETKVVFLSGMSTQRDRHWECSMTGSLRSFSEEAPILNLLHNYACSKIGIDVARYGSCNLIESIPFEMNNFLVIPGDGFWFPNCFSLKSILQFIRRPLVNTLSVCNLRFGNKHAILMTNVGMMNHTSQILCYILKPITWNKLYTLAITSLMVIAAQYISQMELQP